MPLCSEFKEWRREARDFRTFKGEKGSTLGNFRAKDSPSCTLPLNISQ